VFDYIDDDKTASFFCAHRCHAALGNAHAADAGRRRNKAATSFPRQAGTGTAELPRRFTSCRSRDEAHERDEMSGDVTRAYYCSIDLN